jgi:predicted lipoprotein
MTIWSLIAALLLLSACSPWTVVPLSDSASAPADPKALVDRLWDSRIVPAVLDSAVDVRAVLDAAASNPERARAQFGRGPGRAYLLLKGRGRVLAVDAASLSHPASLDVAPFDGRAEVTLQLGPLIFGSALRDATGIIRFSDFVNQLQFADAGNALNQRAARAAHAAGDPASLRGKLVEFAGACAWNPGAPPGQSIVPVRLTIIGE